MTNAAELNPASTLKDIVILGGGLAGTLSAIVLDRAGFQVTLIDTHDASPSLFRAEKVIQPEVEKLKRLNLLDVLIQGDVPAERTLAARAGRIFNIVDELHYGIRYDTMVNRARAHLPSSVTFIKGNAVNIDMNGARRRLTLSSGQAVEGRLVIMATGQGQRLVTQLGIGKTVLQSPQSLTFGFDFETKNAALFRSTVLVAYGEKPAGNVGLLSLFSMGDKLRANLFTYAQYDEPWTKQFMADPIGMLSQTMPSIEPLMGKIELKSNVEVQLTNLTAASNCSCDGLVLIGDAFQTSCPATGTGVGRLLNDIERLCHYIPLWFATDGMSAAKIDQFYNDAAKKQYDAETIRISHYSRSFVTEKSLGWKLHRHRVELQKRLRAWRKRNQLKAAASQLLYAGQ